MVVTSAADIQDNNGCCDFIVVSQSHHLFEYASDCPIITGHFTRGFVFTGREGGMGVFFRGPLPAVCMWSCSTYIYMRLSRSNRVHQIEQSITCETVLVSFSPEAANRIIVRNLCRHAEETEKKQKTDKKEMCLICCKMP